MGKVTEKITLMNAADRQNVNRGYMPEDNIRQATVEAVVDTGASTLIINEEVRQKLGLAVEGKRRTHFANGAETECSLTEPVQINWKDRDCACRAVVIPDACYPAKPDSLGVCGCTANSTVCFWKEFCEAKLQANPQSGLALLGAIPLEDMDLLVDPVNQRLVGAHGDTVVALAL